MQINNHIVGVAPTQAITLTLTGDEYETVLRGLRRLQVPAGAFQLNKASQTYAHRRRAEHLHRELTGTAR